MFFLYYIDNEALIFMECIVEGIYEEFKLVFVTLSWFEGSDYEEYNFKSVICYTNDIFWRLISERERLQESKISDFLKYSNNYNAYFINIDRNEISNNLDKSLPAEAHSEVFEKEYINIKRRLRSYDCPKEISKKLIKCLII